MGSGKDGVFGVCGWVLWDNVIGRNLYLRNGMDHPKVLNFYVVLTELHNKVNIFMKTDVISCTVSVGEAGKCKGKSSTVKWAVGLSGKLECIYQITQHHTSTVRKFRIQCWENHRFQGFSIFWVTLTIMRV